MTTIQANVPDFLAKLASEAAAKEHTSLDNIISIALAAHVGAWQVREDIETRAQRGNLQTLDRVLARVPARPPLPGVRTVKPTQQFTPMDPAPKSGQANGLVEGRARFLLDEFPSHRGASAGENPESNGPTPPATPPTQ